MSMRFYRLHERQQRLSRALALEMARPSPSPFRLVELMKMRLQARNLLHRLVQMGRKGR